MYCDKEFYWAPECDKWEALYNEPVDTQSHELEEGEISNIQDDDIYVLTIPKIDRCTMCESRRVDRFRYCYPCLTTYNSKWYELYSITEANIGATHKFESHFGYGNSSLHTKVDLHENYGDPAFIAANRLGSLIAHQHLLPTHELQSNITIRHKYAAMYYLRSAVGKDNIWINFVGCDLKITSDICDIYLNMFADDIMEQIYGAISILRS